MTSDIKSTVPPPCRRPEVKVVLMSGYPEAEIEARGLSSSGLRLLRKLFEMAELVKVLQDI